jgi:hypothetical protein
MIFSLFRKSTGAVGLANIYLTKLIFVIYACNLKAGEQLHHIITYDRIDKNYPSPTLCQAMVLLLP